MLLLKWMVCEWLVNRNRETEEKLCKSDSRLSGLYNSEQQMGKFGGGEAYFPKCSCSLFSFKSSLKCFCAQKKTHLFLVTPFHFVVIFF